MAREPTGGCVSASGPLVRVITCGSVDDGKSTLIGRLLHERGALFDDELAAIASDSRRYGTRGGEPDFALALDGLGAEREQGITIDVAYRHLSTPHRRLILADTPGHEEYTRNTVTAASTADAAILLLDARKGMLTQTRRHTCLAVLLGIRTLVLAVNKMDLIDDTSSAFERIRQQYLAFVEALGEIDVTCIPTSGLRGDNVVARSAGMAWYRGPTLLEWLDGLEPGSTLGGPLRLPVQIVNRRPPDVRGLAGRVLGGSVSVGDRVCILPGAKEAAVTRVLTADGDAATAVAGESVTVVLEGDLDVSRGDMLVSPDHPPAFADQFEATIVWMHAEHLVAGRSYWLKHGARTVGATVAHPKYRIDVDTLDHLAARTLALNEIGVTVVTADRPLAFDPYTTNRDTGGFILVDRVSNDTVAAGLIHFALRRSENLHAQALEISKAAHAAMKSQRPCIVWFTGLSGAGKSTIANLVARKLHAQGRHTYLLDGDNLRLGLNKDLGFTEEDRIENVRRAAEVAALMVDAGLIVLVALISPYREQRAFARSRVAAGEFCEVFVDTPLEVAEARDPKGLYRKARSGALRNFTGVDAPYEAPLDAEVTIDTQHRSAEAAADSIVTRLAAMGVLG